MTEPLTESEREFLVTTTLTNRQLAAQFECTHGAIKRVKRQIGEGKRLVFFVPPPRIRKKVGYRYGKHHAPPKEAHENPFGQDSVVACELHLADLKAAYPAIGVIGTYR